MRAHLPSAIVEAALWLPATRRRNLPETVNPQLLITTF